MTDQHKPTLCPRCGGHIARCGCYLADSDRIIASLRRTVLDLTRTRDFWRRKFEGVIAGWIGPDPDEERRAAIHRLARKVEAKRRTAA